jgi:hypothetical protein
MTNAIGLLGAAFAAVAFVLLAIRCVARGQAVAPGRGEWDAHVAIHIEPHASSIESEATTATAALVRGDESVEAWLARVDGLPALESAYRAGALDKQSLWETLRDGEARPDARMAAARLLRRRFHEAPDALVRVADDVELRDRIEAAADDEDEAPRRLERLGPLFRAR